MPHHRWLLTVLLLIGLVFSISCITINPTPTTAPASTPKSQRPDIEAFISTPDMQPSYTIAELAAAKANLGDFFKEDYYANRPYIADKYKSRDLVALKQALADLHQLPWQYKANYFDCSEMSALVELYLQVAGFDTVIVVGRDPQVQGAGHAWVVVFLQQPKFEAVPVEATALSIPRPTGNVYGNPPNQVVMNYGDYLKSGWPLRDIYEALIYNPKDFDWWNSYPLSLEELFGKPPAPAPAPTPTPTPSPAPTLIIPKPKPVPTPTPTPTPVQVKKQLSVSFDGWRVAGNQVSTTIKGPTVVARVTLSYGEPGQYNVRIRRDIVGGADETIKQSTLSYDGVSGWLESLFTPPYATGEANTDGYHLDLLKDGYTVWTLTDAYPPRLRVTLPAPKPTPTQVYRQTVLNTTISLKPGYYQAFSFIVEPRMRNVSLVGSFDSTGGVQIFYLMNEDQYAKKSDYVSQWKYLYASEPQVHKSNLNIPIAVSGRYYLVFSNVGSFITTITITTKIDLIWEE